MEARTRFGLVDLTMTAVSHDTLIFTRIASDAIMDGHWIRAKIAVEILTSHHVPSPDLALPESDDLPQELRDLIETWNARCQDGR